MNFPEYRARRVRHKQATRGLLQETRLSVRDLILPLHVVEGRADQKGLPSYPGLPVYGIDQLGEAVDQARQLGIGAVMVQPLPEKRDDLARGAVRKDGLVARAIAKIRKTAAELTIFGELDPSPFSEDGHPGPVRAGQLDNDAALELVAEMAVVQANAGADFVVAATGMDGEVGYVRELLDEGGVDQVGIVACSAYYDSAFARSVVSSPLPRNESPEVSSYRLNPANVREAVREANLDIEEGADCVMVRPALACLDVLARFAEECEVPLMAFVGPGEYQMLEAAVARGWIERSAAVLEQLLAAKRAGADGIVTLHAIEAARALAATG